MRPSKTDYGPGARVYDVLSWLYSAGAIQRAQRVHLSRLAPDTRILYAGCGSGSEAVLAAARGARVTLLDTSAAMLARARSRFSKKGVDGRFVQASLADFSSQSTEVFDYVAAPFFLNVFGPDELAAAFEQLNRLLASAGQLWIADFHGPTGAVWLDRLRRLHYLPPLVLFRWLANNPWHVLYDYPALAKASELRCVERVPVRTCGLPFYEALRFDRKSP
jgi:demethylmenaquinone methyltransferase/2-methoxy-6-polyprenyl-1,4-benzoquinol methylase